MNGIKVRRQLELRGTSAVELERRVEQLCQDVRERNGSVLDIRWLRGANRRQHEALVLCQLPLASAGEVASR